MNEDEFKNNCPNLWDAINSNQQWYEIYGIMFISHSIVEYYDIRKMVEFDNVRYFNCKGNFFVKDTLIILN